MNSHGDSHGVTSSCPTAAMAMGLKLATIASAKTENINNPRQLSRPVATAMAATATTTTNATTKATTTTRTEGPAQSTA